MHDGEGQPHPQFLSIQLADLVNFAVLAGAALLLRRNAPVHKRLILMATICIADAGFDRWIGDWLEQHAGTALIGRWVTWYMSDVVLILAMGAYDLMTRGRLLKAYVAAAAWAMSVQVTAVWLYFSPWWREVAVGIIGR